MRSCLQSVRADAGNTPIVVVDSASRSPGAVAAVAAEYGATLVRVERPGASRARNAGWRHTDAPLVAFVDDDCTVLSGWAATLRRTANDRAVSFVTGRAEAPAEQAGLPEPVGLTLLPAGAIDRTSGASIGGSNNLAVRRAALEQVGGFDERLGPGTWFAAGEDTDLLDRLLAAGHLGWHAADALVLHHQWRPRRTRVCLTWSYAKGNGARLAKLSRADRARARLVARDVLWRNGLRALARDLRLGYQTGVVVGALRVTGAVTGYVAGLLVLRPPANPPSAASRTRAAGTGAW